jgi:aspartyl protease
MIPVQINGKELSFLFDTGGTTTMIGKDDALSLKLPIFQGSFEIYDLLGNISRDQASVAQFGLGRLKGKDKTFPVSPFGISIFSLNFMLPYDIDVDFGNDKLNFFSQDHCAGRVQYWTAPAVAVLPLSVRDGHMTVPVTLDGHEFIAIIDTGATHSTLRMDIAQRSYDLKMGTEDTPEAGVLNGDKDLKTYMHIFKSLTFGDISVGNAHVTIIPDVMKRNGDTAQQVGNRARLVKDEIVGPPILIGMNVLRQLHVYMAFGERKLYISPASPAQPAAKP